MPEGDKISVEVCSGLLPFATAEEVGRSVRETGGKLKKFV
jgi:hypothetical protein